MRRTGRHLPPYESLFGSADPRETPPHSRRPPTTELYVSPATVLLSGSHHRSPDGRISSMVRLGALGLEFTRFRSAFGCLSCTTGLTVSVEFHQMHCPKESYAMSPLFDRNCNLVAWMTEDRRNVFDTSMRWRAYISNGHVWSAESGNWLGNISELTCRDRSVNRSCGTHNLRFVVPFVP